MRLYEIRRTPAISPVHSKEMKLTMDAAKLESLKELSKSALEAGSYRDAYKYSTSLLELDPSLNEAWLIKAAAGAGLMAESDDVSLEEVIFSLGRGAKGASQGDLKASSKIINGSYKSIINSLDNLLKEKIVDHHKVPMPQGGSVILHRVAQKGFARLAAKGLSQKRVKAIKLLEKSYDLDESEGNLKFLVAEIDSFLSHSTEYSDYLNDEPEIKSYLLTLRSSLVNDAYASGVAISSNPPKGSGCFIATAATGSYDHPKVMTLRVFRDSILKKYALGKIFISIYYSVSPPIAHWIEQGKRRKRFVLCLVVNPLSRIAERVLQRHQ